MKRILALLGLAASLGFAAEKPQDFSWQAAIRTEINAPFYRITLPIDAYLNADQPYLQDLRVFNAAGLAVPYARTHAEGSQELKTQSTAVPWFPMYERGDSHNAQADISLRLKQNKDGTLLELKTAKDQAPAASQSVHAYVLDASAIKQGTKVSAIVLDWESSTAADGFQRLDVEVSDDLQNWQLIKQGAQLARLIFNGERIESRRIELSGLNGRYIRLQWRDPQQAPALRSVELEQDMAHWRSPALAWSAKLKPEKTSLKLQEGEYYYKLARPIPISRLRVALPAGNALLPVQIIVPQGDRRHWYSVAHGVAYRIASNEQEWLQNEIALPGTWLQSFIVRLDPRSSLSAQAPQIELAIQPEQIVFLAEGSAPYTLALGHQKLASAALPLATLVPRLGEKDAQPIIEATLEIQQAPSHTNLKSAAPLANRDWEKIALWGVLIAGVLAMGLMAWQLLRQMQKS